MDDETEAWIPAAPLWEHPSAREGQDAALGDCQMLTVSGALEPRREGRSPTLLLFYWHCLQGQRAGMVDWLDTNDQSITPFFHPCGTQWGRGRRVRKWENWRGWGDQSQSLQTNYLDIVLWARPWGSWEDFVAPPLLFHPLLSEQCHPCGHQ